MLKSKGKFYPVIRYYPEHETGLTASIVAQRKKQGLVNEQKIRTSKTYRSIFFKNIFTFFNLIWVIVAALLFWVGAYEDMFFISIVLLNILIGIIQEIKAKHTVEKLSLITAPTANVIRDGKNTIIQSCEIVLDDIMLLSTGKQITSDSIVVDGFIEVNEALLTGESVPVKKNVGDSLYAGSFVSSGSCSARVEQVGNKNYIQQLAKKAKKVKDPTSQLLKSLKTLINIIGIIIIPLTAMVVYKNYRVNIDFYNIVTKSAGAVIGMIPSGMFLLTSVALAVGVINLAQKRTLVQDLYCIEMLARTTTLCLDKTGTITDGTMIVKDCIALTDSAKPIEDIIGSILFVTKDSNQTSLALLNKYNKKPAFDAHTQIPFSSSRKLTAVSFDDEGTYALGAAEFVSDNISKEASTLIKKNSMQGYRVLMVSHSNKQIENQTLPDDLTPVYLIIIEDHIRKDAADTIKWFKDNGVKVKIISGDNPVTVSNIAKRVGVEQADKYISLDKMSDADVYCAATRYTVFGRVSPEQKAILVKALKDAGETVAMTGDGVNDILSLKEADCSVAMASGSEAARNVANLVLLDSNFSAMPMVVEEGRRVINNIQQTSTLFLMKTLFVILLIPSIFLFKIYSYPFNASQMMILELFVIGMPSFFLALQPNKNLITGNFLATIIRKALPPAILMVINVVSLYVFGYFFKEALGIQQEHIVTLCIYCTTFIGFAMLGLICYPFNKYRATIFGTFIALAAISMLLLPNFFDLRAITWTIISGVMCMIIVDFPLLILLTKFFDKIKIKDI